MKFKHASPAGHAHLSETVMSYRYDPKLDRMVGHDWPGVHGPGLHQWVMDEVELGARAALALDDPEQGVVEPSVHLGPTSSRV